ncbi:MAG: hypothetical protein J6A53_07205 [Clostridia bacterium]|nr:hypothetical protein [Clostridia bacterium]
MRKLFITVCELDEISYLPNGVETELFGAPLYEHAYRKIKDASNKLDLDVEFVRAATFPVRGATNELNPDLKDIVAVVSPFVFLSHARCIEDALNFVVKNDSAYATVGNVRGLFAVIGLGEMLLGSAIGSPVDFIHHIDESGAVYKHIDIADGEKAVPVSRIEYYKKLENYRNELIDYLIMSGVDIECRDGIVIAPNTEIRRGTKILPNTKIGAWTMIFENCVIGPDTTIVESKIHEECVVNSSKITLSDIEKNVHIGPYCIVSNECHILSGARLQGHIELSHTIVGLESKIQPHTVINEAEIGARVSIGSNVTTVNHVEAEIRKCKIGDDVIVGSGSCLVLPLNIGMGARVAAGSVITDDVPPNALAIAREFQENKEGWAKKRKRF